MDGAPSNSNDSFHLPVSGFHTSVDQLLKSGALQGAARPGLLGNAGRFEVLQILGSGGMGIVFLARDPHVDTKVAIKFLRPEHHFKEDAAQRFRDEAHLMQRLQHPGILPVLEVIPDGSTPAFVMPYMEKGSLAGALRDRQPLPREQILKIATGLAEALVNVHARLILHRDLKPANVLLKPDGTACLADFGLHHSFDSNPNLNPDASHCVGTAPYMSPAVAHGHGEDTRCDIYGFGALLYEMLTGRPPYAGATTAAILEHVRTGPPPPIRQIHPAADPALTRIAEGAMARELRERYAQMSDVLDDLRRCASGLSPLGPRGWRRFLATRDALQRVPQKAWWTGGALISCLCLAGAGWWLNTCELRVAGNHSPAQVTSWANAVPTQWDSLPGTDLIVPDEASRELLAFTGHGQLINSFGLPSQPVVPPRLTLMADLTNDGQEEAFVSWIDATYAHCAALNQSGTPLYSWRVERTRFMRKDPERQDLTWLLAQRVVDLDGDGTPELLAFVISEYSHPRGLYCFDLHSKEPRWNYELAGLPCKLEVTDLQGDGSPDIILGTHASWNGLKLTNDTTDGASYLVALSNRREEQWRIPLGDGFTSIYPLVPSHLDSPVAVYAWMSSAFEMREDGGVTNANRGAVYAFDVQGNQVGHSPYDAKCSLASCVALPASGKRGEQVVATDFFGRLHTLSLDLSPLRPPVEIEKKIYDQVHLRILGHLTTKGDSGQGLVLQSIQRERLSKPSPGADPKKDEKARWWRRRVIVLNDQLDPVASYAERGPFGLQALWNASLADLDGDGTKEILWLDERLRVLQLARGRFSWNQP